MVNFNMKVLVVDDYATMQKIVKNLLSQIGFKNVELASDGSSAFQKLQEEEYGLVLTDWNMEPITGIQLLRMIRENPATKNLPVIMLTAESKTENVIVAKEAGVNNYIVKPFTADVLKAKIQSVLGDF